MRYVACVIFGVSIPILLLLLAWSSAPSFATSTADYHAVVEVASRALIDEVGRKSGTVYVSAEKSVLPVLRKAHKGVRVRAWEERPPDKGCESTDPTVVVLAPCERDDFVRVDGVKFPLWGIMLVSLSTFNSGHELLILKLGSTWKIIDDRWFVI